MKKSVRLVFFGTENFSIPALTALLRDKWPVVGVVTKPDAKSGRGQLAGSPGVKKIAEKNSLRLFQPSKLADIEDDLTNLVATHGVLVAYGKIIPKTTLDAFPGGIINLHPSLLPKYRGPAPVEAPILNGDPHTGLSLMKLSEGIDAGPVYYQVTVPLSKEETRLSLTKKLSEKGADLLVDKLDDIVSGRLEALPQNDSKATYTKLLYKADGSIDWREPAEIIERKIRAYLGYPKTRAEVLGHEVVIIKARVAQNQQDGSLVMECSPGWLEILELITPNGRTTSGADFMRGYR
ncbi:MAG: methionyl-tRNA formyltransferase [Candidatus Saccharimonadales bacterium]